MNEYNEGDLIEAVKGERSAKGRLVNDAGLRLDAYDWTKPTVELLLEEGWTLTVIEKATPPLPTEPGYYYSGSSASVEVEGLLQLLATGHWLWVGNLFAVNPDHITEKEAQLHLPLTRLEPEVVTARRVLEAIETVYGEDYLNNSNDSWNTVARQFGVTP